MQEYTGFETNLPPSDVPQADPCPWCRGRAYTQHKSDLLDAVVLAQDMLADLKKLIEEVVS